MLRLSNRLLGLLLRSPLHRMMSGSLMLLTFTGRRSGRRLTTPVQYVRRGNDVLVMVGRPEGKQWWRNFRTPAAARLRIRGAVVAATGRLCAGSEDPAEAAEALGSYLDRFPRAAKALGLPAAPSAADLDRAARAAVFVVFTTDTAP